VDPADELACGVTRTGSRPKRSRWSRQSRRPRPPGLRLGGRPPSQLPGTPPGRVQKTTADRLGPVLLPFVEEPAYWHVRQEVAAVRGCWRCVGARVENRDGCRQMW